MFTFWMPLSDMIWSRRPAYGAATRQPLFFLVSPAVKEEYQQGASLLLILSEPMGSVIFKEMHACRVEMKQNVDNTAHPSD